MDNVLKCLKEYFVVFESHYATFQQNISKAQRPLVALSNQSEQLRMTKEYHDEENDLPDLKNRLVAKIIFGIEDEISSLKEIVAECRSSNLHLKRKLLAVENACIADENMYKGDSTHPPPSLMVEWSGDAWKMFHVLYIQMHYNLSGFRYEDEKSVLALKKAFSIDDETQTFISYNFALLVFTSYQEAPHFTVQLHVQGQRRSPESVTVLACKTTPKERNSGTPAE